MSVDWASFTPAAAATGGGLIGLAVALLLLVNGRVAGVSGIVGGMLRPRRGDIGWRLAFVAGLLVAPIAWALVRNAPAMAFDVSMPSIAVAGLLVGLGTRFGAGCTSGHGICGMSRLSPRSIVATLCFMLAGMATVFVIRHALP